MKFGDEFHKWAQTGSTIVQAVAVVFGVGFAVQQLQGQEWEQRHRQVEATMEQLKQLESDPVRTSYQAVLAWRDRVVPAPSAADIPKSECAVRCLPLQLGRLRSDRCM